MKVLVATKELIGQTIGEVPPRLVPGSLANFCYVPEGELLMPLVFWEIFSVAQDHRYLDGVDTPKATTNFKVVEQNITIKELEDKFFVSLETKGWMQNKMLALPPSAWKKITKSFAKSIARAAERFPVDDVLSKNGCTFWSRKDPSRSAKIIVRLPRDLS